MHHLVHPNRSRETRISVSVKVVLRWSDECLPYWDLGNCLCDRLSDFVGIGGTLHIGSPGA